MNRKIEIHAQLGIWPLHGKSLKPLKASRNLRIAETKQRERNGEKKSLPNKVWKVLVNMRGKMPVKNKAISRVNGKRTN